jgi:hypothetical protein
MSESTKAVFLSYASQDKEAARKICEALRQAGLEVWFDVSELRGGDAWDQKIRKQIKECALFIPLITPTTNSRPEGYFRLEWKLAVDRSHLLADDHPFLFPIVIGDVNDATARVPDRFRDVQWTRLRLDETPAEIADRVRRLLSGSVGAAAEDVRGRAQGAPKQDKPQKQKSLPRRVFGTLVLGEAGDQRSHSRISRRSGPTRGGHAGQAGDPDRDLVRSAENGGTRQGDELGEVRFID